MVEHTPTPWKVVHTSNPGLCIKTEHLPGYFIVIRPCSRHHIDHAEANAAFIVRACNAHEKLVKALSDLVEGIDGRERRTGIRQVGPAVAAARAALTDLEGK